MDLSFPRLDLLRGAAAPVALPVELPLELAVLLVGVASRQAASVTAGAQATIGEHNATVVTDARFAPASGAFCAATADVIRVWKGE